MTYYFPTDYAEILDRIQAVNPVKYAKTRNFLAGAVTYLSPYISRGVISVKQVWEMVHHNGYTVEESEKFIQELAWREYFQRVWQSLDDAMFEDIRQRYSGIQHKKIPTAIPQAATGITAIDQGITDLYETGYMHNHIRMYTASITCNIGKAHWHTPSKWMYYHLLDGDLASNTCSWQWVAGTFSAKQYYCNQENINKYTNSLQQNTFLDNSYELLPQMPVPQVIKPTTTLQLITRLPETQLPQPDASLPLLIYNSYNLDPTWHSGIKANRILLLEPSHFKQYPVSEKVISFILSLAKNIEGIQVFSGEINEIPNLRQLTDIRSKEHPAYKYYPGKKEPRDWMFEEITDPQHSFFSFWKKCKKILRKKDDMQLQFSFTP